MIDFTECEVDRLKAYGGANGQKIHIRYQDTGYMLKFPPVPTKNKEISYTNSCISEYLACHVYETIGIPVQQTLLGTYTDSRGREKIVVACRDFTEGGKRLIEFALVKNTCVDSVGGGYGTELSSILQAIEEQKMVSPEKILRFFWDMFIVDSLVGNFDRHNGNWGVLVDEQKKTAELAPVYDCGSCLYPQLGEPDMEHVIGSRKEINNRIFVFPASAIKENGKKINYFDYISSLQNPECNAALKRIYPKIDLQAIKKVIEETPFINPVQKTFYYTIMKERKEKILEFSMKKLIHQEKECSFLQRQPEEYEAEELAEMDLA